MANQNSLIALAYIKEMDNPLEVFCNYIRICLQITPGNSLKHDELAGKITEQFGLKMPHHMIKMCCRILEKEKKIEKIPQGAGYLLKDFSFDLNAFEVKKEQLQFKERLLVNGLISCAEDYNIQWDYPQAREHLTNFLLVRGNAVSIFSSKTVEVIEREKYIPNEWYVGKYISHLLECNDDRTDYLIDIINGRLQLASQDELINALLKLRDAIELVALEDQMLVINSGPPSLVQSFNTSDGIPITESQEEEVLSLPKATKGDKPIDKSVLVNESPVSPPKQKIDLFNKAPTLNLF